MFRRIELIHPGIPEDGLSLPGFKQGLTPFSWPEITDAWIDDLVGPSHGSIPANSRFYFTERGWRVVGRNVIAAAMRVGQAYRVVAIKETDAQVVWRDKARDYEVAVQPPRKRRDTGRRRMPVSDTD